jgi:signal transduction histidine kinase
MARLAVPAPLDGHHETVAMLKKGLVLIAVPLVFQILFAMVLLQSQRNSRRAQDTAIHTKDVIAQGLLVSRLLAEVQGQTAGLILTDHAEFQRSATARAKLVPQALRSLERLVRDNPPQAARVQAIAQACREYLDWQAETRALALAGQEGEAIARVRTLEGRKTLERIRDQIDGFLNYEEALDIKRQQDLQRAGQWQTGLILTGIVAAFIGAVVLLTIYSRTFSQRVNALVENARRLAEGKILAEATTNRDEIGEIDRAFHLMARALAERDRENEMFIYSVSHDLRSPLVNLQGFSKELELSSRELRDALEGVSLSPDKRQQVMAILDDMPTSVHFIQNAVTRLSGIIDALLRLSRAGRVEYRRQPIDMKALVGRVVESLRVTAGERQARIEVADDLPPAYGDATAVEQIFANLLGNALNYLDPRRPGRITVGGSAGENGLNVYEVRDNGLGIAEAHQPKLFTAFQRLHPGVAKGEGIGLSLVRRMVERHGGRIWVESTEHVGTTFFLTLPAPPDGPDVEPAGLAAEPSLPEEALTCRPNR